MTSSSFPVWGKQKFGWVLFWVLILALVNGLVLGLVKSTRCLETSWLVPFGILAIISGWALSGKQQGKWWLFLIGVLGGVLILSFYLSNSFELLTRAYWETTQFILMIWTSADIPDPDFQLMQSIFQVINHLDYFWGNVGNWVVSMLESRGKFIPQGVHLAWGTVFWCALFTSGWLFRRKIHAMLASLPVFILLVSILGFTRQKSLGLIMVLGSILFLSVLLEHLKREFRWQHENTDYSEEIRFDTAVVAIPLILVIVTIAGVLPTISIDDFREIYNDLFSIESEQQHNLTAPWGLEQIAGPGGYRLNPGLPRRHLIGAGPELSEILVMKIDTGEIYLPPEIDRINVLPHYYWLGRTYDVYNGQGWQTSEIKKIDLPAEQIIIKEAMPHHQLMTIEVEKSDAASSTLYAPGLPRSVNQPVTVGWREIIGDYFSAQLAADSYQVTAYTPNFNENQLKESDVPPSELIQDHYLQIPESTPSRVVELAIELTRDAKTPFEKVKTIETYLRKFEYTLDLPSPPEDRDVVDYFLFDLQKGYCDYYASAMVILSRAVGIPARMAVGYTSGSYDYVENKFVVTEVNAHAWPEIYLAPFGWVPFEPTAAQPTHLWQHAWTADLQSIPKDTLNENPIESPPFLLNLFGVLIIIAAILLIGFVWYFSLGRIKRGSSPSEKIELIYRQARIPIQNLYLSPDRSLTVLEYQRELLDFIEKRIHGKLARSLFRKFKTDFKIITSYYILVLYSNQSVTRTQLTGIRWSSFRMILNALFLRISLLLSPSCDIT